MKRSLTIAVSCAAILLALAYFSPGKNKSIPTITKKSLEPFALAVYSSSQSKTLLNIFGTDFGTQKGSITKENGEELTVIAWHSDQITARTEGKVLNTGNIIVVSAAQEKFIIPITDAYSYEWFAVPDNKPGTNAVPLSIAIDSKGRVWINQEFHQYLQVWEPETRRVRSITIPRPQDGGPFAINFLGKDMRTPTSEYGEAIAVDSKGYVWFTEGGALYDGNFPNHSRILRYDPNASTDQAFRVYNIPGDNNQVVGLAFDPDHNRIWFTSSAHGVENYIENGKNIQEKSIFPPKLVSFDPERVPYTNGKTIDYSKASRELICKNNSSDNCYREYSIPILTKGFNTGIPAHLVVDGAYAWYTAYWGGNYIGRLDVKNGTFARYPLPPAIGEHKLMKAAVPLEAGPGQIASTREGYFVFTEYFDNTISRLRPKGKSCEELNANNKNICIDELVIPRVSMKDQVVHSLALDDEENIWFTQSSDEVNRSNPMNSVGYVTSDWERIIMLPPLGAFTGDSFWGAGITVGENGDIWFADYLGKRIGHLEKDA